VGGADRRAALSSAEAEGVGAPSVDELLAHALSRALSDTLYGWVNRVAPEARSTGRVAAKGQDALEAGEAHPGLEGPDGLTSHG
jgi:hypothetical protein